MFKFKNKLIIATMLLTGIVAFMSCEKEDVQSKIVETSLSNGDKKMSLEEFIKSVESEKEKSFFAEHKIVDNRKVASKLMNSPQLKAAAKPKIKFKWGGNGCTRPIGICLIIPIGNAEANATATVSEGKYIVTSDSEDNGITSDGYLPIYEDLYVDENTTIEAGIYTANYDEQQEKYTTVALDIK